MRRSGQVRLSLSPRSQPVTLPQGSPASPVLFLLYIADILLEDTRHRFGYADDICFYRASKSLQSNARQLANDLNDVLNWGKENKVTIDPEKSELLHFTCAKDPGELPSVTAQDHGLTIHASD